MHTVNIFIQFLDFWLDCLFFCFFGAPTKSGVARLSRIFASDWSTNFQDRLVMTTSITLRMWNCLSTEIIGFIKFLDIWLDCLFFWFFGAPTKSGIARGSRVFVSDWSTNFQDTRPCENTVARTNHQTYVLNYTTKALDCQYKNQKICNIYNIIHWHFHQ